MPKPRKKINKALPSGWRFKHGAYYYRPKKALRHLWDDKTEYRLGGTLVEAYKIWADKITPNDNIFSLSQLIERYELKVMPKKAEKTQESNIASLKRIRLVFGNMKPEEIKTTDIFKYKELVGEKNGKKTANLDLALISHLFSKAIEWGVVENHPSKSKVPKFYLPPRDRYVEDWEILEVLKVANPLLRSFIWIKLMTGARRGDILSLEINDIFDNEGIKIKPSKTQTSSGAKILIPWTPELLEWRDYTMKNRPSYPTKEVFITTRYQPYQRNKKTSAFDTLWQRFIKRALDETNLTDSFQQRDLRAKTASDTDLQHASKLLGHTSQDMAKIVYRRHGDTVNHVSMSHLFDQEDKNIK